MQQINNNDGISCMHSASSIHYLAFHTRYLYTHAHNIHRKKYYPYAAGTVLSMAPITSLLSETLVLSQNIAQGNPHVSPADISSYGNCHYHLTISSCS